MGSARRLEQMICAALWLPMAVVCAIEPDRAERIVRLEAERQPGDDIRFDYRGSHVVAGDLDGDGHDEIVFLLRATCIGSTSDCTNDLSVLSRIRPADPRFSEERIGYDLVAVMDPWTRAVYDTGYFGDGRVHIPGEVKRIGIEQGGIVVEFEGAAGTPICKSHHADGRPIMREEPCPPDGLHRWTFAWRPQARLLERVKK
ncbi:hypothetical protein [Luteimonas suaedae]|uniref:hypothetical protein n=1 Tax=Luteimonas suaedae TaxID=2605430 RepID=UPI0011EFCA50|nr:hypothetical protein [Luteimonas suaedae]